MSASDSSIPARMVVFLGPDGAGKSTIIGLVEARLRQQALDVRRYYFAPGFFPRYRQQGEMKVTTAPHAGRQYGQTLSAAKVALLLCEFVLGVREVRRQRHIALFDRYILDLLVDPVRYRLGSVRWWMRAALSLAPKPDLLIIVSAPSHVVQARKQEVPVEETERQLAAYSSIAKQYKNAIVVDNEGDPTAAADAVLSRLGAL